MSASSRHKALPHRRTCRERLDVKRHFDNVEAAERGATHPSLADALGVSREAISMMVGRSNLIRDEYESQRRLGLSGKTFKRRTRDQPNRTRVRLQFDESALEAHTRLQRNFLMNGDPYGAAKLEALRRRLEYMV